MRQEIARSLQGLYDRNRYEEIRDKLYSAIHVYEAEVKTDIAIVKEKIKEKHGEINETEAMLAQIKTQKMLEPERAEGTELFRSKLKETGQAFLPFYAAVEFAEHVYRRTKRTN